MAKSQKKSNKEIRKPKAEKSVQKTISITPTDQMSNLMHPNKKK